MKEKLFYLAHPYTPIRGMTIEENINECIEIANDIINMGFCVFVPVLMTHPLDLAIPRNHGFWMQYDKVFMEKCDGLILTGAWGQSRGCLMELEYFRNEKKEIYVFNGILLLPF